MKTYYCTCPDCGAHLDPGESCDCWKQHWYIEVEMPDGDRISARINGTEDRVRRHYESQGARVLRLEKIA